MPQFIDVKEFSTFGSDSNVLAQYSSTLPSLKSRGLALSAFNLSYGETNHAVQEIKVKPSDPAKGTDTGFNFDMAASMQDRSGNKAISAATFAAPAVFSTVSGNLADLAIKVEPNPGSYNFPFDSVYAVLSGFDITYGENVDHNVLMLRVGTNASLSGTSATITNDVAISDSSNHSGTGTVQALLIGRKAASPIQLMAVQWLSGAGKVSVPFNNVRISQAVVFIRSFQLQFTNNDHQIRQILVDAGNNSLAIVNSGDGGAVEFSPKLTMTDGTNLATGNLQLLVMAVTSSLT